MARGIDPELLDPFPTVVETRSGAVSEAFMGFLQSHVPQPSYITRLIVREEGTRLSSLLVVTSFGLTFQVHRGWNGDLTLSERTPCCGDLLTTMDGVASCRECKALPLVRFADVSLRRDDPPEENDKGELVPVPNSSFLRFESQVQGALEDLGIDPLSAVLVTEELRIIFHDLIHEYDLG